MNKQLIAFERDKVYLSLDKPAEPTVERKAKLQAITEELKRFNYFLPTEAVLFLSDMDMEDIHKEVLPALAEKFYPQGKWAPLYPGFPAQVLEKSEKELMEDRDFIYETLNYDEFLKRNSWYTDKEKEISLKEESKNLSVMREEDLLRIFTSIVSSGNSISETTKKELLYLLEEYPEYKLPSEIPFKETLCLVMSKRPEYLPKTINDLLRFGLYLGGADPELIHVDKNKKNSWGKDVRPNPEHRNVKLSRSTRKEILTRFEEFLNTHTLKQVIPDAKKFYGHWLLLSERLHAGDYTSKFPKTVEFFSELKTFKNNYKTWESALQEKYNNGEDILSIAKFISSRPGELVRKFDSLLRRARKTGNESDLLDVFLDTGGMKNKTLLELLSYYDKRNSTNVRLISIKGTNKKRELKALEPLPEVMVETVRDCIERKILINIENSVTKKDLEGKLVYIDPKIKNIPIPRDMRNAETSFTAGMRFNIPEDKNYLRLFSHWIDKYGHEDLDLSAAFFNNDSDMNIGWNTSLKSGGYCAHSGDVRLRKGDCSEFVDIDINGAIKAGWKYIMMNVHNYQGRGLDTLDNWIGYTLFDTIQPALKTWVPKNPDFTHKVTVKENNIVAWIFDLEKRQAILVGSSMYGVPINDLNRNRSILKFFTTELTFNTWNVLQKYYSARGAEIVSEPIDSDEIDIAYEDIYKDYTKVLEILG